MRREEEIFFEILRSVLWGTPANIPGDIPWQIVLNLAARQKCLHAFSMWNKVHAIKTPYDKHLQSGIFTLLGRHARLNRLTVDVVNLLRQHGIAATLIKGYGISSLYPDPDMRDFGDVDIYVGEENYHRSAQIVTEAYPDAHWHSDIRGGIHYILVLDENQDRVVELHRVTMEFHDRKADALYQAFTKKYLSDPQSYIHINDADIPVPPAAYNALYVFMHAWHHFESTGVGFRQLGDWALCLKHAHEQCSKDQWQTLVHDIDAIMTALHMKTVWQTFGHVLVEQLHLPLEAFPLYTSRYQRRAKRLLKQLIRDGHAGRTATWALSEMCMMRSFPLERPKQNRFLQVLYTAYRLTFEAWQMAKLFPSQAWHEFLYTVKHSINKHK